MKRYLNNHEFGMELPFGDVYYDWENEAIISVSSGDIKFVIIRFKPEDLD